jgi:uncharacterized protein GlcG (DUF336 family)
MAEVKVNFSLETAERLAEIALAKARELGIAVVFAAVDTGGNLIVQKRMDGSFLASLNISLNKAFSAVAFQMPTHELAPMVVPGSETYGIGGTNNGRIVPFGGGFPCIAGDELIGGIGVSGGTVDEDMIIGTAALSGLAD